MKKIICMYVTAIVFSLNAFAQEDVRLDESIFESGLGTDELKKSSGTVVERGIFFTKSFYKENASGTGGDLLTVNEKKKLSKIFETEVSESGRKISVK